MINDHRPPPLDTVDFSSRQMGNGNNIDGNMPSRRRTWRYLRSADTVGDAEHTGGHMVASMPVVLLVVTKL